MKIKYRISMYILLLGVIILMKNSVLFAQTATMNLTGPYLGQEAPGMEPQMFVPDSLRSNAEWFWHCAPVFTPDGREFYLDVYFPNDGIRLLYMEMVNNSWTAPQTPVFAGDGDCASPSFTENGGKVFFISAQPNGFIWTATRTLTGWADPEPITIPAVPSLGYGWRVSVTNNETLYMQMMDNTANTDFDIYRVRQVNGVYTAPERLSDNVNSQYMEINPFIDPDENYIIFSSIRPGGYGNGDLYISFKQQDGTWTEAINMGESINTSSGEGSPFVSADGLYLFFNSDRAAQFDRNPYWVDAQVINDLNTSVKEGKSASLTPESFQLLPNYPNPFNPTTTVRFDLPFSAEISINIINIRGDIVRSLLVSQTMSAGSHSVVWDGKNESGIPVTSGEYFCSVSTDGIKQAKKMLLLR